MSTKSPQLPQLVEGQFGTLGRITLPVIEGPQQPASSELHLELGSAQMTEGCLGEGATVPTGEDSDANDDEREFDLPHVAGNLSPRLVVVLELTLNTTSMELNIDSLDDNRKRGRKAKGNGLRAQIQSDRQLRSSTNINNSFQVLHND